MHSALLNVPINAKYVAITNITSCIYVLLIVLWLYWTDSLYEVGHFGSTYLQLMLLAGELLKYAIYTRYSIKEVKKHETKKFRLQSILKGAFTILALITCFHAVAVLFGAPFFSKQQETFTFAITMTILTVLPCCLYIGINKSIFLILSLTSFNTDEHNTKFLRVIQWTCFSAWLGAVIIPLDWNRPYQVWPIPCILGALTGFFLGNLLVFTSYIFERKSKKKLKVEC